MAQTLVQSNISKNNHKTILQRLEGLQTRIFCMSCGTPFAYYSSFDPLQVTALIQTLTGSCPGCHRVLKYRGEETRFIVKST